MLRSSTRRSFSISKGWDNARRRLSMEAGGRLNGKVALITGAASGIGESTATEFIQNGAKVIIADIQHQLGQETAAKLGPDAAFISCDVTRESDLSAAVDFAVAKHGCLDIMYNNAGIPGSLLSSIANLDLTEFDRVMAVNVRGAIAGIKHAARVMIPRRTGCILCTASNAGILGGIPLGYSVSKFAVVGIVKAMASELCSHGIRVNCISPFVIRTPLAMNSLGEVYPGINEEQATEILYGMGELAGANCEPSDIAKAAVYLASDDAKYVSGHNLVVDGGFTSFKRLRLPQPDRAVA